MNILAATTFPKSFLEQLRELGFSIHYHPHPSKEQLQELIAEVEVLLIRTFPEVQKELIDKGKKLKLVCRAGVGMDHVDQIYLREKGIDSFHTPGANADSVGEQTVGMLLSLLHHIPAANEQVKSYQWEREAFRGRELQFKTVGLIGYGHTGKAVARRLKGFGCTLLAYDKYISGFGDKDIEEVSLRELQKRAEILSLHVPLTSETHQWVDSSFFAQFEYPIYLLNLSRGKVVHLPSLLEGLEKGLILGAALDVLPNERLSTHTEAESLLYRELFSQKNVILTPHVGGWTFESRENIQRAIINRLLRLQHTGL